MTSSFDRLDRSHAILLVYHAAQIGVLIDFLVQLAALGPFAFAKLAFEAIDAPLSRSKHAEETELVSLASARLPDCNRGTYCQRLCRPLCETPGKEEVKIRSLY